MAAIIGLDHASSRYAPFDRASGDGFTPQPSPDSALTSYAQLTANRIGTERAFISLFDPTYQYVLAEATPTLSLIGGHVAKDGEHLKLGCCVFPKEKSICHYVDSIPARGPYDGEAGAYDSRLVVLDITKDHRFEASKLHPALSEMRFYMAVPLISPMGFKIGALSVMDTNARLSGPDQHSLQFMKDMAETVMDHLAMKETSVKSRRAERMIVGLGSFVEGRSTLRDSWPEAHAQHLESEASAETTEGQLNIEQQDLQELTKGKNKRSIPIRESSSKTRRSSTASHGSAGSGQKVHNGELETHQKPGIQISQQNNSARAVFTGSGLKEDTLQSSIRNVFSRAANLLRESIGAEGVMFLDANSQRFGNLVDKNKRRVSGPDISDRQSGSDEESTDSERSSRRSISDTDQSSDSGNARVSECLGFSSSRISSINDEERAGRDVIVPEPLFSSLIHRYPRGKIFTFNAHGSVSEDSDRRRKTDSGSENEESVRAAEPRSSSKRRRKPGFKRHADDLIKIFAGARNILILPIWDSDRNRWFAGALVWTNEPNRIFTTENELVYTSAFSNSIMAEIRRIDVELAERAKTNLVSSITHELRNPLHGILGTADILGDTAMNALQHGMVHTVESCGRTLLDTINSLLDLTFIDQYRKGDSSQNRKRSKKSVISRSMPIAARSSISHVELDAVLEEVTDCVFAGYSFYNHPHTPPPALSQSSSRSAGQAHKENTTGPRASQVTVIFDIEPDTEWDFDTHAGAWRRIFMNIFGNALKYTSSGYIYIGLKSSQRATATSQKPQSKHKQGFDVTITVKDTGKGIGAKFLQDELFSPFKQEDSLAPGSGLGLSIVRKAVGFLGGSIEIESTVGKGTELSIYAPLVKSATKSDTSSAKSFSALRRHTEDKTLGILGFGQSIRSQRDRALYSSMERLCSEWFGLKVTNISPSDGKRLQSDFYLAVQTELDCEDVEGRNIFSLSQRFNLGDTTNSPVIVICQSPEEAHRMFIASKNQDQTKYFEFVSQPCGPRKLARAMSMCLKRQGDQDNGRRGSDEPTRWVEVPQSSHLPVDIEASDPPADRMKIGKRPTRETMGAEEENHQTHDTKSPNVGHDYISNPDQRSNRDERLPANQDPFVLLVDDNDINLQLLCAYVKKDGLKYMSAKDGAQAVELYKTHPGVFQIVIIDISMPVMNGFQASQEIRKLENEYRAGLSKMDQQTTPPTIIAALTGLDSAGAQKEALGSGINTFLVKPLKRPELQAVLRRQI
ncbi:hypothetical protein N7456_007262 [Penicillium angulare]|uniref:Uncharacterized protein n=1 Tax=Penicillium angulare TaxID=116970 RepID=A0A9W9FJD7_9EURO|nr:hypothetical protein N7456_007262 [Penicillium angulare]